MLEIISAKVTATPGPSGWAQAHEFIPDTPESLHARGRLSSILATKRIGEATGPEGLRPGGGIDTIASGRQLIGRLHDEYFGSLEEKPFNALRNATQKVVTEFKESWGDIEIAACAFTEGVVYSAASGGAEVVICRDGALATILASSEDVITASGYPKEGDMMLLATKAFFQKIPIETVKTALTSGSPEAAAEIFASIIHGDSVEGNLGAIVMKFEAENALPEVGSQNQPPVQENVTREVGGSQAAEVIKQKLMGLLNVFKKRIPQKNIYVKPGMGDEVSSQSKKLTFSVGVILLVVLMVSIGFGIRQKGVNDLKKKYQGILTVAESEVDQAIGLASVSPDKSRELFTDSERKLSQILALKVTDPKVDALQKKIEEARTAILGEYDASPALFLDLSLLSSGFKGDALSVSGGQVYVVDKTGKRIVSIAIDTKKSKVIAGPSVLDDIEGLASYQDSVFVLGSDGIYEVGNTKTKVIEKTWTGESFISAFAGNMYVLDKNGNAIYRYSGTPGGTFGSLQNWLSTSTKANFANAVSWSMDGAIYVLYPNSKILKYSLGSPQNFSLTGITPQIGNIDAIYADPDNVNVYLLDRAGKRVVVIDKKGSYKAQYVSDQIAGATALMVSESQKEMILLAGDKLLSVEIKHL